MATIGRLGTIDRQSEVNDLRRFANTGKPISTNSADTGTTAAATAGQQNQALRAVDAEVRLTRLEEKYRSLVGKTEDLTLAIRDLKAEMKKLNNYVTVRLSEMEGKIAALNNARAKLSGGDTAAKDGDLTAGTGAGDQDKAGEKPDATKTAMLPKGDVGSQYEFAVDKVLAGHYGEAEQALQAFIAAHGEDPLAGSAQHYLGETYYLEGKYVEAAQAYLTSYQKYPNSPKAPESLLKLGKTLSVLKQKEKACAVLSELETRFPAASNTIRAAVQRERRRAGCKS